MSDKKKTVLIVTPSLNGLGGVANYYKTILPLLEGNGFSIDFLETGSAKGKGNIFYPITDQLNFYQRIRGNSPALMHINPSLDLKSFIRDGLLVYQAICKKIPVVVFFRGWDKAFAQVVEKYFLGLFRATYGKANAFIVLADEFKEKLRSWQVDAPIYIETTTVNPSLLRDFDIKIKTTSLRDKESFRILYLARIERAKGVFETVDAIKMLYDKGVPATLSIAGDGPAKHELEAYVNRLQLPPRTIVFLGYVRDMGKTPVFKSHEIYCFPTYYKEGLPNAVLEALAFGMPVITCAVGGLADIFKDGEMGMLVPPRDPEAIASAIEQIVANKEEMVRMAQYNHTYAKENFLAPKVAERLLNIYQQILDKQPWPLT